MLSRPMSIFLYLLFTKRLNVNNEVTFHKIISQADTEQDL